MVCGVIPRACLTFSTNRFISFECGPTGSKRSCDGIFNCDPAPTVVKGVVIEFVSVSQSFDDAIESTSIFDKGESGDMTLLSACFVTDFETETKKMFSLNFHFNDSHRNAYVRLAGVVQLTAWAVVVD